MAKTEKARRNPCRQRTDSPLKPAGNAALRCDLHHGHDGAHVAGYTEDGKKRQMWFGYIQT